MALAIKASIRAEQVARVASFNYDRLARIQFMFPYFVSVLRLTYFEHRHPNVCVPLNFAAGLLPAETSNVAEITGDAAEVLSPISKPQSLKRPRKLLS